MTTGGCPHCGPGPVATACALFVHGIGVQRPGRTLGAFTGPLLELAGGLPDAPANADTLMSVRRLARHAPDAEPVSPARRIAGALWGAPRPVAADAWPVHEIWEVTTRRNDRVERRRWLLAESCWARSFALPGPWRFAWLLTRVAPWMALYQMGAAWSGWYREARTARDTGRGFLRAPLLGLAAYLGFAPRLLVTVATLLACPVLAVLGSVPVIRVPVTLLIDFLGDSLVAMSDAGSRVRMADVIRKDLHWCEGLLPETAQRVVVAHSQGAMLTREMLAGERDDGRRVFVGLGSGLGLLHGVNRSLRARANVLGWVGGLSWTAMLTLLATAGIGSLPEFLADMTATVRDPFGAGAAAAFGPPTHAEMLAALSVGLCALGGTALRLSGLTQLIAGWHEDLRLPPGRVRSWWEFSSPYDPVSCGTLLTGVADHVVTVVNGWLLPAEHGGYRRNPQVRLHILRTLSAADGLRLPGAFDRRVSAEALAREGRFRTVARIITLVVWAGSFALTVRLYLWLGIGDLL